MDTNSFVVIILTGDGSRGGALGVRRPDYMTEDDEYYVSRMLNHFPVKQQSGRRYAIDESYVSLLRPYVTSRSEACDVLRQLPVSLAVRRCLRYVDVALLDVMLCRWPRFK